MVEKFQKFPIPSKLLSNSIQKTSIQYGIQTSHHHQRSPLPFATIQLWLCQQLCNNCADIITKTNQPLRHTIKQNSKRKKVRKRVSKFNLNFCTRIEFFHFAHFSTRLFFFCTGECEQIVKR